MLKVMQSKNNYNIMKTAKQKKNFRVIFDSEIFSCNVVMEEKKALAFIKAQRKNIERRVGKAALFERLFNSRYPKMAAADGKFFFDLYATNKEISGAARHEENKPVVKIKIEAA